MKFKKLEKHNIIDCVRRELLLEFNKEDLLYYLKDSRRNGIVYTIYYIENLLQELVNEGQLGVYYISVKVEPLEYYYGRIDNKVGSKSVAIYKSLRTMRAECVEKILN